MPEPLRKFPRRNLSTPPKPAGQYALANKGVEMAGQGDDKTLRRIILMLLSLAVLAERAGGACWPVRRLVLWALRPGEAVARDFVREVAQVPFADLPVFPNDDSSNEALRLAMIFRMLAAALEQLLMHPRRFAQEIRRAVALLALPLIGALPAEAVPAPRRNPPNDTS